jgi:hypothetical protein
VAQSLAGAFFGGTLAWVVSALAAPGDYLDANDPRRLLAVVVVGSFTAYAAQRAQTRGARAAVAAGAVVAAAYWVAAPSGWWASPPPMPSGTQAPAP